MNRVGITGLGAICGLGHNLETVWKNALAGKSGISQITDPSPEELSVSIGGEVKDYCISPDIFSSRQAARYDPFLHFALHAGLEAFRHAGLHQESSYGPSRMGVILGVGMGGFQTLERNCDALFRKGGRQVSPFMIPSIIPNMAAGLLSLKLNLQGVSYTVSSACASSNHALNQAFWEIQQGRHDVVLSGGAESVFSRLAMFGFANMKALSKRNDDPPKASRPFDRDRDGFVMGEGAGVLVLENMERARKRGATVYAELVSCGVSSDAHHITAPHPEGRGAVMCMNQALEQGNISPDQVDYVNAHGTSTPQGDRVETRAIKEVFGAHVQKLPISSTKSMTGHLLGAAGGLESVFCIQAIATGEIPPTINLDNPDPECDLFYVPHKSIKREVRYALNNSFGFGGTNASVIFRKV